MRMVNDALLELMILAGIAVCLTVAVPAQNMTTKIPINTTNILLTTKIPISTTNILLTTKIPIKTTNILLTTKIPINTTNILFTTKIPIKKTNTPLTTTVFTRFTCPPQEYLCSSNNECIEHSWICDGDADCEDGQDESKSICDITTCQRLQKPKNGRRIKYKDAKNNKLARRAKLTLRVKAKFKCRKGYKLVGQKVLVCGRGGFWSFDPPICVDKSIKCPKIESIRNGTVEIKSRNIGEEVSYKCNKDFRRIGPSKRTCLSTGKWSKSDPKCIAKSCRSPKWLKRRFKNGKFIITDQQFRVWSNIIFDCNDGYYLSGKSDTMTCREDEKWHPSGPPRCPRIFCGYPGIPKNGRRLGSNFTLGSTIKFYCSSGHKLTGSSERTCQADGTWSGDLTVCDSQAFDCRDPGIPANCYRDGDNFNIGDTVEFECHRNYVLRGSSQRTCKGNGTWTGREAFCDSEKIVIIPPLNETMELFEKNVVENLAPVTCSSNKDGKCHFAKYRGRSINVNHPDGLDLIFLFDASSSIKQEKFKLGLEFACHIIKQFGVDYGNGGTRIAAITFGSRPSLVYNLGDADVDSSAKACTVTRNIKYSGGGTATRAGLGMIQQLVVPEFEDGRKKALIVIADGKSNFGGSPEKMSRRLILTQDVEIFAIGVGRKINKVELKLIASPGPGHIFHLKDYDDFLKLTEKMIKKDYSKCGEGGVARQGRMIGGKRSIERQWPWQVAIFRNYNFICGGALIEKDVILTAAHCFQDSNDETVKRLTPNSYHIVPGQIKLVLKSGEKEAWLEDPAFAYRVDKLFPHQDYVFGGDFANDIALIKLKVPVKWSSHIRPVCLPKPSHYLKADTYGFVAGFGFFDKKKPEVSSKLLHASMPVRTNETCKLDGLKKELFCAGDGKGKIDSCKGDSGGPFVVKLADNVEETQWSYKIVGIVSNGVYPCAQKDEYGFYTRISNYVEWIKNTLNELKKT